MFRYMVKRLLLMVPTIFGAAVLVFILLRIIPGDVCELRYGGFEGMSISEEAIRLCHDTLGLDRPKLVQFGDFIGNLVVFDLG